MSYHQFGAHRPYEPVKYSSALFEKQSVIIVIPGALVQASASSALNSNNFFAFPPLGILIRAPPAIVNPRFTQCVAAQHPREAAQRQRMHPSKPPSICPDRPQMHPERPQPCRESKGPLASAVRSNEGWPAILPARSMETQSCRSMPRTPTTGSTTRTRRRARQT